MNAISFFVGATSMLFLVVGLASILNHLGGRRNMDTLHELWRERNRLAGEQNEVLGEIKETLWRQEEIADARDADEPE